MQVCSHALTLTFKYFFTDPSICVPPFPTTFSLCPLTFPNLLSYPLPFFFLNILKHFNLLDYLNTSFGKDSMNVKIIIIIDFCICPEVLIFILKTFLFYKTFICYI